MGWRPGEIWLEAELRWFREPTDGSAVALALNAPAFLGLSAEALAAAIPNGLAESRRRRAEHRRRRDARKTRTAALVLGPAVALTLATARPGGASRASETLERDPPSQTLRLGAGGLRPAPGTARAERPQQRERAPSFPAVEWREATAHGLPYAGSLTDGTQLPVEGPDWVTWNPVTDSVPNHPRRLYAHERTIRRLVSVLAAYREASPEAPRVVVGDISFRGGGPMELHRSHQNGLDVDVYYPRLDRRLRAPRTTDQVDRELSQALLDRFLAAGAQMVFVGYRTGLRGPKDVVIPYPNHEDHLHVRFRKPRD